MAVTPKPVTLTSRLVVIGAMVVTVVAQGFYVWAASLTFWPGPGQSPTYSHGLLIVNITSAVLVVVAILTMVVARAKALALMMGVSALLILINFGLWIVVGIPAMTVVVILGWVWLARSRRVLRSN